MTTCKSVITGWIAVLSLAGCAIAPTTAPAPATSHLRTQSLGAPTEILIKFRARTDEQAAKTFGAAYGLRPKEVIQGLDVHVMTIQSGEEASVIVTRLARSPLVDYAEPNHRLSLK